MIKFEEGECCREKLRTEEMEKAQSICDDTMVITEICPYCQINISRTAEGLCPSCRRSLADPVDPIPAANPASPPKFFAARQLRAPGQSKAERWLIIGFIQMFIFYVGGHYISDIWNKAYNYPEAQCEFVHGEIISRLGAEGDNFKTNYSLKLSLRVHAKSGIFTAIDDSGIIIYSNYYDATNELDRYKSLESARFTCWYNPEDISSAIVARPATGGIWTTATLLILSAITMLCF